MSKCILGTGRHCFKDGNVSWLIGQSTIWVQTEILNNYWMDCNEMLYKNAWFLEEEAYRDFGDHLYVSIPLRLMRQGAVCPKRFSSSDLQKHITSQVI